MAERRTSEHQESTQEERSTAIDHLEKLRQDIRDEIKLRIKQRDQYSIQLIIALSTLVAISISFYGAFDLPSNVFSAVKAFRVLIAAPLVSIYFTALILYSYRVHKIMAGYLSEEIEPELTRLCGTSSVMEWETYYKTNAKPGIRKPLFIGALWIVCIASPIYVAFAERWQGGFMGPLAVFTVIYIFVAAWITVTFRKD